jgi:hypothetical protein
VRISHRPSLNVFATALALGALSLASSLAWAVPPVSAEAGPANVEASELVRLINGVRGANGLGALQLDPSLAGLARDTPISCPGDASLVMLGRTRDAAENNYVSHSLRLCPDVKFVSVLQTTYNYWNNGEIMLQNGGYGSAQYLVSYAGSSSTYQTYSYSTTGHAILGWLSSGTHAPIVLGGYDRVGCGGWLSASGVFWYDCLFSLGGPNATTSPPTRAPFADPVAPPAPPADPTPAPTANPTPAPTRPPRSTAASVPAATPPAVDGGAGASPNAPYDPNGGWSGTEVAAYPTLAAPPTAAAAGIAQAAATSSPIPTAGAAAANMGGHSGVSANSAPAIPAQMPRGLASVIGLAAAMMIAVYALVLMRRRRRRIGSAS